MESAKKYSITVCGQTHTVITDKSPEHITQATVLLDTLISTIMQKSPGLDPKKAVTLAALKLASQNLEKEEQLDTIAQSHGRAIEKIHQAILPLSLG